MSTYIFIPGAGGVAWYWHRVLPLIRAVGHEALAVDLPGDDPDAGLDAYADLVIAAMKGRDDVILVAQSLGGFTAAAVCARVRPAKLVFVNAMIPLPGETAGAWWGATGSAEARIEAAKAGGYGTDFDLETYFLHDVPADVLAEGAALERPEADRIFGDVCAFDAWPKIPIRVLAGEADRLFPAAFQARVALDRLGIKAETLPGGHLNALSEPEALVAALLS